jgi:hypothetical protein
VEHEIEREDPLEALTTPAGIGMFALRLLRSIVAWPLAQYALIQNPIIKKNLGVKIRLIHIPHPSNPSEKLSTYVTRLMLDVKVELTRRGLSEKQLQKVEKQVEMKTGGLEFTGAIHCEASLMGLTVAAQQPDSDLPDGIRESFEVSREVDRESTFADIITSTATVSLGSERSVVTAVTG